MDRKVFYLILNLIYWGVGLFLLIGPYKTGFWGFIFWVIMGSGFESAYDKIYSEEKDVSKKNNDENQSL